jgi:hypothetical protein
MNYDKIDVEKEAAAGENANHIFLDKVYMTGGALAIASTTGRAAGASAAAYAAAK